MKQIKSPLLLAVTLYLTLTTHSYGVELDNDEQQLRHIKQELWPKAYKNQDVALLNSILAPSFELVTSDGKRFSKADELASLPNHRWPHKTFAFEISRLDIYEGKFAIVSGEGRGTGKNEKGPYCFKYQSSNVLHKIDSKWRGTLSHVSGVTSC